MKAGIERLKEQGLPLFLALVVFVVAAFVFCWRIGSITHGLASPLELQTHDTVATHLVNLIEQNIMGLPYLLIGKTLSLVHPHLFIYRLVSSALALIAVVLFYFAVRRWHGWKIAPLATLLFACSSWVLHDRLYTPLILLPLAALVVINLLVATPEWMGRYSLLAWALMVPLLLYVPGSIWIIIFALIWNKSALREQWQSVSIRLKIVLLLVGLVLLLPLVVYVTRLDAGPLMALKNIAGITIQGNLQASLVTFVHHLIRVPMELVYRSNPVSFPSDLWLGPLPLLDVASFVLLVFGLSVYLKRWNDSRSRFVIVYLLLGWFIAALNPLSVSYLVVMLYMIMATGLAFLLRKWYGVFPRNPVARSIGLSLLVALVLFACNYQLRSYFIAWPHATNTQEAYTHPLP